MKTKASFGSINVNVAAKSEGEGGGSTQPKAIELKPVTDAYNENIPTNLGVIEHENITTDTELKCADGATAEANIDACDSAYTGLKFKAVEGKLYFASTAVKGSKGQHFVLVNNEGALLEGTLPTANPVEQAITSEGKQYLKATFQSGITNNATDIALDKAIENNTIKIGATENNYTFVEIDNQEALNLQKYTLGENLTIEKKAAPTIKLDSIVGSGNNVENSKFSKEQGASTGSTTPACDNEGNGKAKCQIKVKAGAGDGSALATNNAKFTVTGTGNAETLDIKVTNGTFASK